MAINLAERAPLRRGSFMHRLISGVQSEYTPAWKSGMTLNPKTEDMRDAVFDLARPSNVPPKNELIRAAARRLVDTLPREDTSRYFKGINPVPGRLSRVLNSEWGTAGQVWAAVVGPPVLLAGFLYSDIQARKEVERVQHTERVAAVELEAVRAQGWGLVKSGENQYQMRLVEGGTPRDITEMIQEMRAKLREENNCAIGRDRVDAPHLTGGTIYEIDCKPVE